ncbi:MAG TPA: LPS export ABC transporter periplasmic protein LptC, partial [Vicinamibacteria bacterium]
MNAPPATQRLRTGLLAGLVLVAGVVAWSFRRPGREAAATPPASVPSALPSGAARTEGLSFRSFKGEKQSFMLKAAESVGQEQEELRLKQVDFTFSYTVKGDVRQGNIKADSCLCAPSQQRGNFEGNVTLTTDDGFLLKAPTLNYRGDKGVAKSDDPVTFARKDISGSSTGLVYHAEEGKLELLADVKIHVRDPDKPPADIQASRATLLRQEGTMFLEGAVQVDQQGDHLTADRFEVDFGEDRTVSRARAIENVVLKTASGAFPGTAAAPAAGSGPRELRCRKLDLRFRPDRTLEEATAGPDADLVLHPGPKDEPERRRLEAKFLTFKFDEQGRLTALESLRDTKFTITPLKPAAGPPRTVTCARLVGQVDPESGEPKNIEF